MAHMSIYKLDGLCILGTVQKETNLRQNNLPSLVYMDHLTRFSKTSKQNKPQVSYTPYAYMIWRLPIDSVAPYKFFKLRNAI